MYRRRMIYVIYIIKINMHVFDARRIHVYNVDRIHARISGVESRLNLDAM